MRTRTSLLAVVCAAAVGCGQQTIPCGTFTFTGSPTGTGGETTSQSFAFNPSACSTTCTCNQIAYVQIVRAIDRDTGQFISPNTDQTNRMVTGNATVAFNGWAVDRLANRVWGYYGRNNDGAFSSTLIPGSNTAASVLLDTPNNWPESTWFDAVDVPVCLDQAAACKNGLLGYDYWLFIVAAGGATQAPLNEIGVDWNRDAVDLSIAKWNSQAPGLGKNQFPSFTRYSNQLAAASSTPTTGLAAARLP